MSNHVVLENCDLMKGLQWNKARPLSSVVGLSKMSNHGWFFLHCDMKDLNLETRRPLFYGLDSVKWAIMEDLLVTCKGCKFETRRPLFCDSDSVKWAVMEDLKMWPIRERDLNFKQEDLFSFCGLDSKMRNHGRLKKLWLIKGPEFETSRPLFCGLDWR